MEHPSDRTKRPRVLITLGDPNGIGPEVVLKTLADSRILRFLEPLVIGSAAVLRHHAHALGYSDTSIRVVDGPDDVRPSGISILDTAPDDAPEVHFGETTEEGGRHAMRAIERAVDLCMAGEGDALVTAPISKEAINKAGYHVPGHTEFLADRTQAEAFTMMMVSGDLRVGLVTTHVPVRKIAEGITREAILEKLRIISESLERDFGISRPKIAVLGLNPHAGDGGRIGPGRARDHRPSHRRGLRAGHAGLWAVRRRRLFRYTRSYRRYDAVLAMYHDQGLVPFKALSFNAGINFTAGLPIIRCSPDHGTAFDIAGELKALPDSMRQALYLAVDVARRRAAEQADA